MKYEYYPSLFVSKDLSVFEFIRSENIRMRIVFQPTLWDGIYNLAFGDVDVSGEIDDQTKNSNGDRNKILATIARAVDYYTGCYPNRWIYFCGNTKGKNRLYRMAIGLNWEELSRKFEIFGDVGQENFCPFYKNMEVSAFLVKRKLFPD